MATIDDLKGAVAGPTAGSPAVRFRWTAKQYYKLAELGFFGERRVELIGGEIWTMTTNPPHSRASELLNRLFFAIFGAEFRLRVQLPLDLGRRNQPEPDMAVLRGNPRDSDVHPTTALLIVEISDSTLRKDRVIKSHLYARAGIADYWIVNLVDRQLEIRRKPGPDPSRKGRFTYHEWTVVPADGHASPLAKPDLRIAVADLLP